MKFIIHLIDPGEYIPQSKQFKLEIILSNNLTTELNPGKQLTDMLNNVQNVRRESYMQTMVKIR